MLPSDMRKKRTGKERLAGQVAMHWYNRGYRGRTLHQKIEESLAKGKSLIEPGLVDLETWADEREHQVLDGKRALLQ